MRHTRHTLTAVLAVSLAALSATAFAPAPDEVAGAAFVPTRTVTVDGFDVEVAWDGDDGQPAVLLVGTAAELEARYQALSDGELRDVAVLDLGCGDVGGPQDVAAILAAGEYLAGRRASDDGRMHRGNGQVALLGDGIAGLQALLAASSQAGRELFTLVMTRDAWADPYDALHLGGVARVAQPTGAISNLLEPPAVAPPLFPCETGGASDGSRDAWWAQRSAIDAAAGLTLPTYAAHVYDAEAPLRQSHALREAQVTADAAADVAPFRVTDQWVEHDDTLAERQRDFLRMHLSPHDDIREQAAERLRSRSGGFGAPGDPGCLACAGRQASGGFDVHSAPETPTVRSYFLNRTFEQDLGCTPACVPGPGTGEVGTLEEVNRFETPWAPVFTWADAGANNENVTHDDPLNDGSGVNGQEDLPGGHGYHSLAFRGEPFDARGRIVGTVRLEGWFDTASAGGTITPVLNVIDDEGHIRLATRGAFDLDFSGGPDTRAHVAGWKPATVAFEAIQAYVGEGYRIEVVLQSNNVGIFEPGTPQGTVNVATGPVEGVTETGSVLHVPVYEWPPFP